MEDADPRRLTDGGHPDGGGTDPDSETRDPRVSTGIAGLDEVLEGGLFPGRTYMVLGGPGTGKTLVALAFLEAGAQAGETTLFVNLEEDVDELKRNAANAGIDTTGIDILDLSPNAAVFTEDQSYRVFEAADVEGEPITQRVQTAVERLDPERVVIDPISQFRYLTSDDYQFRKQLVGLSRFLGQQGATVVATAKATDRSPSDDLQFLSDGNVLLRTAGTGRRLEVPKFRGSGTLSGPHGVRITDDGVRVFPELHPGEPGDVPIEPIPSGVPEVDELLGGGIERGTITVIAGPTGVGKTTLATQFLYEAASRGEQSVAYLFEETLGTFRARSEAVSIPVGAMLDRGTLELEPIEALEFSPQEFAHRVRQQVDERGVDVVVLDGLAGYELTLEGEAATVRQRLHALARYLKNNGVTTILIDETSDVTGSFRPTDAGISYLTDNIVFLRHLEIDGELRKAIGVLKKRTSDFERTLREFEITSDGIAVGDPLHGLRGILTGTPERVSD